MPGLLQESHVNIAPDPWAEEKRKVAEAKELARTIVNYLGSQAGKRLSAGPLGLLREAVETIRLQATEISSLKATIEATDRNTQRKLGNLDYELTSIRIESESTRHALLAEKEELEERIAKLTRAVERLA